MLCPKLATYFDHGVRSRGDRYASTGHVRKLRVDEASLLAKVDGSDVYSVRIVRYQHGDGWLLKADCSCDYVDQNGDLCKHVWATLKAGESLVAQKWGEQPKRISIELDDDSSELADLEEDDDEGAGVEIGSDRAVSDAARRALFAGGPVKIDALRAMLRRLESRAKQAPAKAKPKPKPKKPKPPPWHRMLQETRPYPRLGDPPQRRTPAQIGSIWYTIDAHRSRFNKVLVVELAQDAGKKPVPASASRPTPPEAAPAPPPKLRRLPITPQDVPGIPDHADRSICALLVGVAKPGRESSAYSGYSDYHHASSNTGSSFWQIDPAMVPHLLPLMQATGRLLWRAQDSDQPSPARWSADRPWELAIQIRPAAGAHVLVPVVRRSGAAPDAPDDVLSFRDLHLAVEGEPGVAGHRGELSPLRIAGGRYGDALSWARTIAERSDRPAPPVAPDELPALLDALGAKGLRLPVLWPDGWGLRRVDGVRPTPRLTLRAQGRDRSVLNSDHLDATIEFLYGTTPAPSTDDAGLYIRATLPDGDALIPRDPDVERAHRARLLSLGAKRDPYNGRVVVPSKSIPAAAAALLTEGWEVLGDAATFRKAGEVSIKVSSGIDWFDLEGAVDFGSQSAAIGSVLAALHKGEKFVKLGDGSMGLLPEDWLAKHARWVGLGRVEGDAVRFSKAQLTLVDALLAQMPDATCDKQVAAARARLKAFEGVAPRAEPSSFQGELRPYQREGLGWLRFLADFGFGGCLADDMGLGKTVQLLAHVLDQRAIAPKAGRAKNAAPAHRPWLVVAPKSLMFNWAREAQRFAPSLRVVEHAGVERHARAPGFADADLVLTTYATMRLDIERLRAIEFECVVLDEAQAIKNAGSQAAKAARLLRASRRLALTGTPVENRLEDLWSIFEFLNPGMLGSAKAFQEASRAGAGTSDPGAGAAVLRRALRPFLLRRTKQLVAPELPARSEQTVACDLEGKQKTLYDGLRKHYQQQLLGRVERDGIDRSKIHVLEALLRLRQAACHPGLIEPKTAAADSAKVATLMHMLEELGQEKHKALVFSQFTSLLALVRAELDARKIPYEYLDGDTPTKDRAAAVDRFQSDPDRAVFLISLKAGGVGLNLTAAGYVFLLDPWWNPAVEAQAIDRTHRIGQSKNVIAYRLIAKNTVEERILELQQTKRTLAESIISETEGPLSSLTRQELEWLLS